MLTGVCWCSKTGCHGIETKTKKGGVPFQPQNTYLACYGFTRLTEYLDKRSVANKDVAKSPYKP